MKQLCGRVVVCAYLSNAFGVEVLAQTLAIAPNASVVNDNGIVDAIGSVVYLARVAGIDELCVPWLWVSSQTRKASRVSATPSPLTWIVLPLAVIVLAFSSTSTVPSN